MGIYVERKEENVAACVGYLSCNSCFASCPAAHRLTLYPPSVIDVTHIFDRFVRAERTKADLRARRGWFDRARPFPRLGGDGLNPS
ncbi:hypothetical protein COLO4_05940 [Corchorus olitorius]|uniref:Uncharacterized protein n=1 Tax=Corchorus olitorius TaxID=93759 RepID=A0A1R3KPJ9_9ROSI|nr:hypothetical protein COLO4_05940 [Corchorus olitorius]